MSSLKPVNFTAAKTFSEVKQKNDNYSPNDYPSISMPQLAIYDLEKYNLPRQELNAFEFFVQNNKDRMNEPLIYYMLKKFTVAEAIVSMNDLIKALTNVGVKRGDAIATCMPGIPEAMFSIYGCAYLGALNIQLPPYLKTEQMISDLKKSNVRTLLIMDKFYEQYKDKFDAVIEAANIKVTVIVPVLNSSIFSRILKKPSLPEGMISYNQFISNGSFTELPPMAEDVANTPLAVFYSSGTTGDLKGIMATHNTIVQSAASYIPFPFGVEKGQVVYGVIPTWSSTGSIATGTTPLNLSGVLHQNPKFDPKFYTLNLGLRRDNWAVATTDLFDPQILNNSFVKLLVKIGVLDYSKLSKVFIGGTRSTPKQRKKLEENLKAVGCNAKVHSSWGRCEDGGIVTAEVDCGAKEDYSVGYPIPGAKVIAVDSDGNELPFGQRGNLAVYTDEGLGTIGYYNRPDIVTKKTTGKDGNEYSITSDIGFISSTGQVIYHGRDNEVSVVNGESIFNFDIMMKILELPEVYDCEVFTSPRVNELCAHIIFYEPPTDVRGEISRIQEYLFCVFGNANYVPRIFKIRDSFPMAASTKRDYTALKQETEGFLKVDFNPSNAPAINFPMAATTESYYQVPNQSTAASMEDDSDSHKHYTMRPINK